MIYSSQIFLDSVLEFLNAENEQDFIYKMNNYNTLQISGIIIVHSIYDRIDNEKLKKTYNQLIKKHYSSVVMIINKENILEMNLEEDNYE